MRYTKPHKSYDEQLDLLQKRGLIINDRNTAVHILKNVNYYRLSAYMLPFKQRNDDGDVIDRFCPGTSFEQVYALYEFDEKLRLFVFAAISRIEIALRTQIIYSLSKKYGSHWTDNSNIFKPAHMKQTKNGCILVDAFATIQKHLCELKNKSQSEEFLRHYYNTYDQPANPPVWMSMETMYFRDMLTICENLLDQQNDATTISHYFGLQPSVFYSWLLALNNVRNICAHHGRLWNRDFTIVPQKLYNQKASKWITNIQTVQSRKTYYILCIIAYMLQTIEPKHEFSKELQKLMSENAYIDADYMGFPKKWIDEPLWK